LKPKTRNTFKPTTQAQSRFVLSMLIGAVVTVTIVLLTSVGGVSQLERIMLDWRFQWFDRFNPTPTDRVVHVDIDDGSLKTIGRWPWPRHMMAQVVDELHRAGVSVVAFDVLFAEHQDPRIVPRYAPGAEPDAEPIAYDRIDDDARFAEAIDEAGNVLLPIALKMVEEPGAMIRRVRQALADDPTLSVDALREKLTLTDAQAAELRDVLSSQKSYVIRRRIEAILQRRDKTPGLAAVRAEVLPDVPAHVTESTELAILREQYDLVMAMHRLTDHLPKSTTADAIFAHGGNPTAPVLPLAEQVAGTGFVTFDANAYRSDGVLRSIPLWMRDDAHRWPQIALAAGSQYLGVPMEAIRVTPNATILPDAKLPDGAVRDVVIPTMRRRAGDGWFSAGGQMLIPWQSNADRWQNLFDPMKADSKQHLPIGVLIELAEARRSVEFNERSADVVLLKLMVRSPFDALFRAELVERFDRISEALANDTAGADEKDLRVQRADIRRRVLEELDLLRKDYESIDNLTDAERADLDALQSNLAIYRDAQRQIERGRQRIAADEARFRQLLEATVCLIGWTGTGSIADFIPTSLEPKVPGVVVHGALLNAMLTDHFFQRAPAWVDLLIVMAIGLAATIIAACLGPVVALSLTVVLVCGYFLFNGMVLFDYGDTWAVAAGPSLAAAGTWLAVTVFRLVAEQRGRARITRQFKNYVAPDLVDYLVDNPNVIKLEGERRELTCLFSDIEGFTTLSEKLGPEGTVNLLNKYLATATDALMNHRATVNKYLGDGIMAFWGAPIANPDHALDACRAVLALVEAGQKLNDDPELADLPKLHTRVGVCTGDMMVGDCGAPPRRSDYTVIGDPVNLASRLENANKQFDTQVLISDRTEHLVRDQMLTRPIGRIVVVGRNQYEIVHELLNTRDEATDAQRALASMTAEAVDAFIAGQFTHARDKFNELVERFGPAKLTTRYLEACDHHLESQTESETFNGALVLTEK